MRMLYDVVIVGGGIVGTAVARDLLRRNPWLKLAVVEKEKSFAVHQSGHNSGVIHCGIYYTPGSLKAKLCVEGSEKIYRYCLEKNIPFKKCGKLIVAVKHQELPRLHSLYERGQKNGVQGLTILDADGIRKMEPFCKGIKAIWSPDTGIVDWAEVNRMFGNDCRECGADIYFNFHVEDLFIHLTQRRLDRRGCDYTIAVGSSKMVLHSKYVITCAGLFSDRLAVLTGCSLEPKIIPFRGDYLLLKSNGVNIKTNIYPVPQPGLPFLGVHFTPRMDGTVLLGPNAVIALKREGYAPMKMNVFDMWDMLSYRGFWKLTVRHFRYGLTQIYERMNLAAQVSSLQAYVPSLDAAHVTRGPSGVRAQALDKKGQLVDDFVFDSGTDVFSRRILHVRNAPSPAATSSLAIAEVIADAAEKKFNLKS